MFNLIALRRHVLLKFFSTKQKQIKSRNKLNFNKRFFDPFCGVTTRHRRCRPYDVFASDVSTTTA